MEQQIKQSKKIFMIIILAILLSLLTAYWFGLIFDKIFSAGGGGLLPEELVIYIYGLLYSPLFYLTFFVFFLIDKDRKELRKKFIGAIGILAFTVLVIMTGPSIRILPIVIFSGYILSKIAVYLKSFSLKDKK